MKKLTAFSIFMGATLPLVAQVSISSGTSTPHPSAMIDVQSTEKGALIPRMSTAQLEAIVSPANGLQVYCTSDDKLYIYVASSGLWREVAYGPGVIVPPFVCGNQFIDFRDGKSYNTVLIGSQCWLAENLNTGTQIAGIEEQTSNQVIEKYCFDNDPSNCETYGGLYQWNEMMAYTENEGTRGICPEQWHLPTHAEWCTMSQLLDPTVNCTTTGWTGSTAGGKIKSTGTHEAGTGLWMSPNTGATNESGFTTLPGGYRAGYGTFEEQHYFGFFWCSSVHGASSAFDWGVTFSVSEINKGNDDKNMGFSVRCVKD